MRGSRLRVGYAPAFVVAAMIALVAALAGLLAAPPAAALASTNLSEPILIARPLPGDQPDLPKITAKGAILVDSATGTVLYSRNPDKRLEMASTTKIMTAILILESMSLDQEVEVPAGATGVGGSSLGLLRGEKFTVEQLLYALMVPSANDAAVTLAVAEAGSLKAFVAKMNARAAEMGLTNTHFVNDCGLHAEGHYSSARDLAKLSMYAMQNPVFRKIVATREYILPRAGGVNNRVIKTSNELLEHANWVDGIKTGSTPWAGYCLVSSGTKDGMTLISVVLGAKDQDTREAESKRLLLYGFDRAWNQSLLERGQLVAEVPALDPLGRDVSLVSDASYSRRLLGDADVTGKVKLSRELTLPIEAGETLGELELYQGDGRLGTVKLVARQSVGSPTFGMILEHWRGPWLQGLALMRFLAARPAAA